MNTLLGGLLIVLLGVILVASSRPVYRLAVRNHTVVEQIGGPVFTWLSRGLGTILVILGLVTMTYR